MPSGYLCGGGWIAPDYPDGSTGAPLNGVFKRNNFFTSYAKQSGQTYATRPPWLCAGADYAIGPAGSYAGNYKDPTTFDWTTYGLASNAYNATNKHLTLANIANLTLDGFDFGGNATGTGIGVRILFGANVTGTLTISNCLFNNQPNIEAEGGATSFMTFNQTASTLNLTLLKNVFDGSIGGLNTSINLGSMIYWTSAGNLICRYNAFLNIPARALEPSMSGTMECSYNYIENLTGSAVHAEWSIFSSNPTISTALSFTNGSPDITYTNTFSVGQLVTFTVITGTTYAGTGLTANSHYYVVAATGSTFRVSATQGGTAITLTGVPTNPQISYNLPGTVPDVTVQYNTFLQGADCKWQLTTTAASTSSTLTFAATGNAQTGDTISNQTHPSSISSGTTVVAGKTATTIPMSTTAAGAGVSSGDVIILSPNVTALHSLSEVAGAHFGTFTNANNTLISNSITNGGSTTADGSALMEIAYAIYDSVLWINNYMDSTGSLGHMQIQSASAPKIGSSTFSGNTSLVSGNNTTFGTSYGQTGT